jgi:hypothetical protein
MTTRNDGLLFEVSYRLGMNEGEELLDPRVVVVIVRFESKDLGWERVKVKLGISLVEACYERVAATMSQVRWGRFEG